MENKKAKRGVSITTRISRENYELLERRKQELGIKKSTTINWALDKWFELQGERV
jgi:hypothetical protein